MHLHHLRLRSANRGHETLLFIHGLGSAASIWKPLMQALLTHDSRGWDLVAVDLPGHGHTPFDENAAMDPRSLAEYVREALDELGIERAHVVGNSLGGWTALELAAAYPERVKSITALAPAGMRDVPLLHGDLHIKRNRYLAKVMRPFFPILLRSDRLRAIGFAHNSPVWRTWSYQTCRDAAEAMASASGYEQALAGTFGKVAGCALAIPATIPVRIIFGDTDTVLPAHTSQSRAYLPHHGMWEVWENCGHAIQLDYPERIANLLSEVSA